jgi:RNA polymerase sigma-70 factor, ECF subfamily
MPPTDPDPTLLRDRAGSDPVTGVRQDVAAVVEDPPRFDDLYREHGARLWRSVLLYAGDPDVASDAVAEAWAQAIRRGAELESPLAWIWRAAFRIAAGELQAMRRTEPDLIERGYEMPEPAWRLLEALRELSPKQRAAVVLHLRDGYTMAETAEIIGSTTSAVGVHVHRARRRLRELLEDDDG